MKDLRISDFRTYKRNPFIEKIYENGFVVKKDGSKVVNTSVRVTDGNGNFMGPAFVRQQISKYIDSREFIRITSEGLIVMSSLNLVEFKIFSYILMALQYNELEIELSIEKIKLYYNYTSRNPIYKGIIGLLSKKIISREHTKKSFYYVNPIYFYKGTIIKEVLGFVNELNNTEKKETKAITENMSFYNEKQN